MPAQGMVLAATAGLSNQMHPTGQLLLHQHEFGQAYGLEMKFSLGSHLHVLKGGEQNHPIAKTEKEPGILLLLPAPHPGISKLVSALLPPKVQLPRPNTQL